MTLRTITDITILGIGTHGLTVLGDITDGMILSTSEAFTVLGITAAGMTLGITAAGTTLGITEAGGAGTTLGITITIAAGTVDGIRSGDTTIITDMVRDTFLTSRDKEISRQLTVREEESVQTGYSAGHPRSEEE